MATDILTSFDSIEEKLLQAKSNLKGLNENIRRIIGREPADNQLRGDRKKNPNSNDQRRGDRGDFNQDSRNRRDSPPPAKRRLINFNSETKSVFSRLSGPPGRNDDDVKPKINSRVIRELPTREEIVNAQGSDAASRARNRRMFGSLLGTLQKFCQEESRLKPKEEKKAQIEKKLEDQQLRERETMKKERQDLFMNRKRQQMEIKMLETKMMRLKELAMWEESKKPLSNFIRTKARPRVYYLPKVLDKKSEKKLAECRSSLDKSIAKKRSEVHEEIAVIESRFAASRTQDNNGLTEEQKHNETTPTKHNRRSSHDDDDNDSNYNSDDDLMVHPNDESNLAPDISIVKKEQDNSAESRKSITNDNANLSDDITPLVQPKTEKSQEITIRNEEESGGTVED
ncbi:pinin [Bradysia coprophila]|uniref:pinin n=1 Tax=Bradysia coprophila TaxID=38358 RepID=UPI00187DBFBB|nr:pinin [Bradysia coprophila]